MIRRVLFSFLANAATMRWQRLSEKKFRSGLTCREESLLAMYDALSEYLWSFVETPRWAKEKRR